MVEFYQNLYLSSNPSIGNIQTFFETISDKIHKVDDHFKNRCKKPFNITEIWKCIGNLEDNRAPGHDGLTSEYYKYVIDLLAPFILLLFEESLNKQELPVKLKQGVVTLIPKPNKNKWYFEKWRPIK